MRQIGSLKEQPDAERIVAYMITKGVRATGEFEDDEWSIWVLDEDQVAEAKQMMVDFQKSPDDPRYANAESEATQILKEEKKKRDAAQKNYIQVRHKSGMSGAAQRAPITVAIIAICIVLTILTGFGENSFASQLMFANRMQPVGWDRTDFTDATADIRSGQIWRIFTPTFIHGGILHLVFNMYWMYQLGTLIEVRKGRGTLLGLVVLTAIVSIFVQVYFVDPFVVGLSGVVYGLFGYAWMKTIHAPMEGIFLPQFTIMIMIVFFFLCFTPLFPGIANGAHAGGLLSGCLVGYLSSLR